MLESRHWLDLCIRSGRRWCALWCNPNRGCNGVRGDVRIGGNRYRWAFDFGVLAYNFLPSGGAMLVSMATW